MTTDARRRRGPLALIIVIVVLAALVGAFFVADNIARGIAEKQVSSEIASRIPGADPSQVTVGIGGVSFLAQLASGRFESVVVDAADVKVQGAPITLHARAASVPTDTTQPIGDVEGSAVLDEAAVNALVAASGNDATVTLQSGTVGYEVDKTFLGIRSASGSPPPRRRRAAPSSSPRRARSSPREGHPSTCPLSSTAW